MNMLLPQRLLWRTAGPVKHDGFSLASRQICHAFAHPDLLQRISALGDIPPWITNF